MMRSKIRVAATILLAGGVLFGHATSSRAAERARAIQSFDPDWRFLKADKPGAEAAAFDDSSWRALDVPHDWSIEGPFDQSNPAGGAGAFLPTGIGWYRKHFTLPADQSKRLAFIEFDGVMANSDVWINGFHLGKRPYGYVSFRYDLTGHLHYGDGAANVLAVRADNGQQPASRWYAGAGINRHVRLILTDPVHIDQWSTFVTTPKVTAAEATVHVRNTILNASTSAKSVTVEVSLLDPSGNPAGAPVSKQLTVPPGKTADVEEDLSVRPELWSLDHPNMYQAVSRVRDGSGDLDDEITPFGIRSAEFKADTGFWLNGENIKLKGVCLHADMDGLGTAVPLAAYEHRLAALKRFGCNAIRTSHNPEPPGFLDLCDRMGFLVMDEMFDCWTVAKNPYDYHLYFRDWSLIDLRDTVRRDRNHPSIVLYSAGNEIHDTPQANVAIPILKSLVQAFHENDPTRPVTQALFRPNVSHDFDDGLADLLDVVGVNYRDVEAIRAHEAKPSRKIIGTENGKDLKPWAFVRDNAPYAGQFLWAGADYLGESRRWPGVSRENGLIDLTDQPHPIAFQRQSWWSDRPMLAIARDEGAVSTGNIPGEPQTRDRQSADWTPTGGGAREEKVVAFSNAEQVELSLNGKSLGSQDRPRDGSPRSWKVTFAPGTLSAVARNGTEIVARDELRTAGKGARIVLKTEHAALAPVWDDLAFVTAQVVDADGIPQPLANDLITFKIDGPGKVVVVENGDVASHEPFQATERHAFRGICTALVKATAATGGIHLTATAPGLSDGAIDLQTTK